MASNTMGANRGNLQTGMDKARDAARDATETARESATGVVDRAREMAGNVADKTRDAVSTAADTARDWATGAVDAVKESGPVRKANEYVSEAWETGSRYIHDHNLKDITEDVAGIIRRNPIPALLVGIGLGFVLARSLRS